MAQKFDDLDRVNVISCSCYVSGCENSASNKHIRGDYVIFVCNDHNPSFFEV